MKRRHERRLRSPLTIIRAPAVFGPGDEATKPIFDLIAKGYLPVACGTQDNSKISMIYVEDLVRFIIAYIQTDSAVRPLEPATIGAMSWNDFAELCSQALNRPVKVIKLPSFLITPFAMITSLTLRWFGAGHLTLQKLAEFRHPDWTSADEVDNPTPMITALRETAASYER
ncbi:hypothetical protein AB8615_06495 [Litorimonas sp. RW-G-Af-16]|uniref:hypothetical protein n=1 Tax=Litorimonas sp. RW-G-Af-16 TaxID=3241168 RepID=UPI003AAEE4A4